MTDGLRVADGLTLSVDYATKTTAILAQRRKGKTYCASVIAEELVRLQVPWVALDPTGAWWGMRAGADGGVRGGLPVTILGGDHGDAPLDRGAGKLVADLVVDEPGWYVLDFSHFESKAAEREFATAFGDRLYRRKGKGQGTAMHLFIDEADLFMPQQSPSGDKTMLGVFEAIVRRGGLRGLVTTLISQRAAVVNKNVLEQIDMLITLRTVGPNDRKAIDGYISAAGSAEERTAIMGSIASLDIGEAWLWEPGTFLLERVQIRQRHTFNSSSTPKVGDPVRLPQALAPVDLDKLRERMATAIEKADADDPVKLRKRIAELERQAKAGSAQTVEKVVEVEVERVVEKLVIPKEASDLLTYLVKAGREAHELALKVPAETLQVPASTIAPVPARPPKPRPAAAPAAAPAPNPARSRSTGGDVNLGGVTGTALAVLAQYGELPRNRLAMLAGTPAKKSTIRNTLSKLRTLGYVTGSDIIKITPAGIEAVGDLPPLPTGDELIEHWRSKLGDGAPRVIFDTLLEQLPGRPSREQISALTGYEGSTLRNAMSKLRTLGLCDGDRLNPDLIESIA